MFWENESNQYTLNWDFIIENISKPEAKLEISSLREFYETFLVSESEYSVSLQKYLKNWNRTFPDVKACLYTFLLERDSLIKKSENVSDVVTKYVHLAEDLIGGKNVGLVHAVISKLANGVD